MLSPVKCGMGDARGPVLEVDRLVGERRVVRRRVWREWRLISVRRRGCVEGFREKDHEACERDTKGYGDALRFSFCMEAVRSFKRSVGFPWPLKRKKATSLWPYTSSAPNCLAGPPAEDYCLPEGYRIVKENWSGRRKAS